VFCGFSFENVPDSGPQSTPINEGSSDTGNVDYWSAPEAGPGDVAVEPTPTATMLLLTGRMPEPTPAAG